MRKFIIIICLPTKIHMLLLIIKDNNFSFMHFIIKVNKHMGNGNKCLVNSENNAWDQFLLKRIACDPFFFFCHF